MSHYENYDQTSQSYDETRQPVAIKRVVRKLSGGAETLQGKVILDAGCGTGQFTEVLLAHGAKVEAVELSTGMLQRARHKLGAFEATGQVRFQQGSITELPLADDSVDGITINQVLHHLPEPAGPTFPVMAQVMSEMRRVLRPGGTFVLNTCSQEQLVDGYWYFNLLPQRVINALQATYAPLTEVRRLMEAAGFSDVSLEPVLDEVLTAAHYHRADGPLSAEWRAGDSTWALLTAAELEATLARVQTLQAGGELVAFRDHHDAARKRVGQLTLVTAR
jgi:ubiquinone/menaquinone biosynthesis C-methylase UbiE